MALTDYVIMPSADYVAACDKVRAKTGKTDPIKSGDLAAEIEGIPSGGGEDILDLLAGGEITEATLKTAKSVKQYLFADCKNLISVSAPKATSVGTCAFMNCTNLETVSLPEVTTLANTSNQFKGCTKLKSVYLPNVLAVGPYSFYQCSSLEIVRLPKGNRLMNNSFEYCSGLQLLDLAGSSVGSNSTIPSTALGDCTALKAIVLRATNGFYSLSSSALQYTLIHKGGGFIYVQRSYIDDYSSLTNWSQYADKFRAIEDYTVDGTVTGELDLAKMGIEVTE